MLYKEVVKVSGDSKVSKLEEVIGLIRYKANKGLTELDFSYDEISFDEKLYRATVVYFREQGFKVNERPSHYKYGIYIEW